MIWDNSTESKAILNNMKSFYEYFNKDRWLWWVWKYRREITLAMWHNSDVNISDDFIKEEELDKVARYVHKILYWEDFNTTAAWWETLQRKLERFQIWNYGDIENRRSWVLPDMEIYLIEAGILSAWWWFQIWQLRKFVSDKRKLVDIRDRNEWK
jgi:hypothetical protein